MGTKNSLQCMMDGRSEQLPTEIEHRVVQQIDTFCLFSRVIELFGPNALHVVSRYICAHNGCDSQGPQTDVDEDVPYWRIRP